MFNALRNFSVVMVFIVVSLVSMLVYAPEIGTDDFRISVMDTDGDANFDAQDPAVAYNSTDNEFLVVWQGDEDDGSIVDNELEIYGQRYDADTLDPLGSRFRISQMDGDGDANDDGVSPAVAYSSTENQYLVVWRGDADSGSLADNEFEIYGEIINADGTPDVTDFRISTMGPDNDANYRADNPDIAYNSTSNEYFVVWQADDNGTTVDGAQEIFGRRIDATDGSLEGSQLRLSDMGNTNADTAFDAVNTAVTYNATENQFLVVWEGDDESTGGDNAFEIFGQLVNANGTEDGSEFRISSMGNMDSDANRQARSPDVAYNSTDNQYLVVWYGDDDDTGLADNENEIFGRRVGNDGTPLLSDFRISDMGSSDNDGTYDATAPRVSHNATANEYLVIWRADDDDTGADNAFEIFGQRISSSGSELESDFLLSSMGNTVTDTNYAANDPAIGASTTENLFLITWEGDDDADAGLAIDELEIYGQFFVAPGCGNSVVEPGEGEDCDDGGESATCNADCTSSSCGDSVTNMTAGEECDDGNNDPDDGCDASCQFEVPANCGDGNLDAGEECDDGNNTSGDGCAENCTNEGATACGDGVLQAGEECDDGNAIDGDGCAADCTDENGGGGVGVCGDGTVDSGEDCDDGNTTAGDGCSDVCNIEQEDDLACSNPDVDFVQLTEGQQVTLNAPDATCGGPTAFVLAQNLPDTCDCSWSITPSERGNYSDDTACTTILTAGSAGTGQITVDVDCGTDGSGSFNQTIVVSASSSGGGCSLIR